MEDEHTQQNDEAEQKIIDDVEKYGCHLALLEADNYLPAFVYSIGLYKNYKHPEIICFGLNTNVMGSLINYIHSLIKEGEKFVQGKMYADIIANYEVQFIQVDKGHYPDYLGYAGWFYNNTFDFPVLQLIWPDKQNKFPWEDDFNPDWKFKQPLLDRGIEFKFYEKKNLAVYTTKNAFEGVPILHVYHNEDGDWQFHTSLDPSLSDAALVCLEEITKLDPSINQLFNLQPGWNASRENKDDDWRYQKYSGEE